MTQLIRENDKTSPVCASCGTVLEPEQYIEEFQIARCNSCKSLLRLVRRNAANNSALYPPGESKPYDSEWVKGANGTRIFTELLEPLSYPNLYCPYCETINRVYGVESPDCRSCGKALTETCLNCQRSLYILEYFCTACHTDQRIAMKEIVANYKARYWYRVQMAKQGHWQEAVDALGIFFNPALPHSAVEKSQIEQARSTFLKHLAPSEKEREKGVKLYWQAKQNLQKGISPDERKWRRHKRWTGPASVGLLVLLPLAFFFLTELFGISVIIVSISLLVAILVVLVIVTNLGLV